MTVMFGRFPSIPPPADPPPPPKSEPLPPESDETERVRLWVTERLEEVGLPYPLALELALTRADWHQVEKAWKRGATLKDIQEMFL